MPGAAAQMDVKTAITTIDRALSYTQPLRRRIEGVTWILFGLTSALFVFSYVWFWERGYDPTYKLILLWLVGYAIMATIPAILTWRIASVMADGYQLDARRVTASVIVLAILLIGGDLALWGIFGETRLNIALNISLFGGAVWAGLGLLQWSKLSRSGRRDTVLVAALMTTTSFGLVYLLRADASTVDLAALIFVTSTGAIPMVAGIWRLVRG